MEDILSRLQKQLQVDNFADGTGILAPHGEHQHLDKLFPCILHVLDNPQFLLLIGLSPAL